MAQHNIVVTGSNFEPQNTNVRSGDTVTFSKGSGGPGSVSITMGSGQQPLFTPPNSNPHTDGAAHSVASNASGVYTLNFPPTAAEARTRTKDPGTITVNG